MYMHRVNLSYVSNKLDFSYRKYACNLRKNTLLLLIISYKRWIRFSQDEIHKIRTIYAL